MLVGGRIAAVNTTLEDVFLKLTGRAIREQEVDQMQKMFRRHMRMRGH